MNLTTTRIGVASALLFSLLLGPARADTADLEGRLGARHPVPGGCAAARERRLETVRFPLGLRGVTAAVMMADKLVKIATAEANSSNEERDAAEKAALLATLGAPESGTLPPAMRSQVKQLEEDQKRRAKRSITDSLDRTLTDLLSFYRDVLIIQLGNAVELVNVELRSELEEFARRSTPESTLARMDAINTARERITTTNVAPLLTIESMAASLI